MDDEQRIDDEAKGLAEELNLLGVETKTASSEFRTWLETNFPRWTFAPVLLRTLPLEWKMVELNGYDLCFLATEEIIKECHERNRLEGLLPLGAFMDGGLMYMDTSDDKVMRIGRIGHDSVFCGDDSLPKRDSFEPFPFSYRQFLAHIRTHPQELRWL